MTIRGPSGEGLWRAWVHSLCGAIEAELVHIDG
jgi:hypothetical protein